MQNGNWPVREFPPISITIREDLTGELLIGTAKTSVTGVSEMDVRRQLMDLVLSHTRTSGYGVAVTASDGEVLERLEVHPTGEVKVVDSQPVTVEPAEPLPAPFEEQSWEPLAVAEEETLVPETAGLGLFAGSGQNEVATPKPALVRRFGRRRVLVVAAVGVAVAACAVAGTAAIIQTPAPSSAVSGQEALWSVPDDISVLAAAGDLVAGTDKGALVLFEGATGKPVPVQGKVSVDDAAKVRAASGGGITVIAVSETSGVVVAGGTAHAYEGKGALLDRGPVPVLVGGTAEARTFWTFRDGVPTQVQPPAAGNSIFGGLDDGGSVWATSGGKVTYVPATGKPRTSALTPPVPGATVSSWLSVSEEKAVVLWKTGNNQVLAEHLTTAEGKGAVASKVALGDGDTATSSSGITVLHQNGMSMAFPAGADDPRCAEPVLTAKKLWCPGPDGAWFSTGASAQGKPAVAGAGFAFVIQNGHLRVVPTNQPSK